MAFLTFRMSDRLVNKLNRNASMIDAGNTSGYHSLDHSLNNGTVLNLI